MNPLHLFSAASANRTMAASLRWFIFVRRVRVAIALVCLAIAGNCLRAHCLALPQAAEAGQADCQPNKRAEGDAAIMALREAPTHFGIMSSRYFEMVNAARGYQCTGTVTVGFDGFRYFQTARGDDPGIMEWVPTLSRLTGLSLAAAYDLTILLTIGGGLLIGYAAFWKLYPEQQLRWIGVGIFLCLGFAEAKVADEYIFQISPLIAGIPWLLYFALAERPGALTASATTLALFCSWCSLVRAGTIPVCMTFLVAMLFIRRRVQKPLVPCLLLILACIPSVIFEQSIIARRDAALARVGQSARSQNSHLLWHTVYIGLGFIPNSEVSEYRDGVAADKVRSIDPNATYASTNYEAIIKQEVWNIAKRKPLLVTGILMAKAGIVISLAMILFFPVRRLMITEGPLLWFDAAIVLTMGMSSLNAIAAVPRSSYLLTFLCLGFLYSALKLCRSRYQSRLSRVSVVDPGLGDGNSSAVRP
jgi:hypothetical protein